MATTPPPDVSALIWPTTITSPDEFITQLTGPTHAWFKRGGGKRLRAWFRGVPKMSFSLEPSLLRYREKCQLEETEKNLRCGFAAMAPPLVRHRPANDIEWLTLMQHHGVPTRLLDWTESAMAALYFAVREHAHLNCEEDAVVWALDPIALTELKSTRRGILFSPNELLGSAFPEGMLPLPFIPNHTTGRITSQRGMFTCHGLNEVHALQKLALDELGKGVDPPFLVGFRVAAKQRAYIRSGLIEALGVSEYSIFPDLDGLARDLRMLENLEGKG